jgi:hypothetical protein
MCPQISHQDLKRCNTSHHINLDSSRKYHVTFIPKNVVHIKMIVLWVLFISLPWLMYLCGTMVKIRLVLYERSLHTKNKSLGRGPLLVGGGGFMVWARNCSQCKKCTNDTLSSTAWIISYFLTKLIGLQKSDPPSKTASNQPLLNAKHIVPNWGLLWYFQL